MAENIAYRHNLAEDFLCNTLGIPWFEVHKHAHQLEHAMTPLVVEKLTEFLGKPEFCPHGTPMPGHKHTILERSEVMQSITLDNGKGPSVLPMHVAQKIIVIPSPALI